MKEATYSSASLVYIVIGPNLCDRVAPFDGSGGQRQNIQIHFFSKKILITGKILEKLSFRIIPRRQQQNEKKIFKF